MQQLLYIASTGLQIDDKEIINDCLWGISHILDQDHPSKMPIVKTLVTATNTMDKILEYAGSIDAFYFVPALRCLGNITSSTENEVIDHLMKHGLLNITSHLLGILKQGMNHQSNCIKEICWMLSNIAAGSED